MYERQSIVHTQCMRRKLFALELICISAIDVRYCAEIKVRDISKYNLERELFARLRIWLCMKSPDVVVFNFSPLKEQKQL